MARGTVSVIELHIEKAVLGLTGLLLLVMVYLYLIGSPNQVEYKSEKVGPGRLAEAIRSDAESLQTALRNQKPSAPEVPDYSGVLEQQFQGGIFAGAPNLPALPQELPLAVEFGQPIPKLAEEEEKTRNVSVVTPLKPQKPVVITGRSLALRQRPTLGMGLSSESPPPDEEQEQAAQGPVELAWASIGAYFELKAQEQAMNQAGYATHRSRVYLVGTDVQRQEMLAHGQFSEWQDVRDSKAMPRLDIPEAEIDESTGVLQNETEIRALFQMIRASQKALVQPEFYPIEAGDFWDYPPLAGFEKEEEVAEEKTPKVVRTTEREPKEPVAPRPPPRPYRPKGGGGDVLVAPGGGGGSSKSGGGGAAAAAARAKREAQQQVKKDLAEAKNALSKKEYDRAAGLARGVESNEDATVGDKQKAKQILEAVEEHQKRQARTTGGSAPPDAPVLVAPGAKGGAPVLVAPGAKSSRAPTLVGPGSARTGSEGSAELITHPDNPDLVAVWFHDDSVEPGKTYRYRMRVKLWNRYVGKLGEVKAPEQAKPCVLVGEWSLPGEPITVTPSTYFFLAGSGMNKDEARVEVWKWRKGDWLKQSFNVGVGDVIGGKRKIETDETDDNGKPIREDVDFTTGAVVLDLRANEPIMSRVPAGKKGEFNLRGPTESLVLVYVDPADGQVKQRVQVLERFDPIYQKLKEEYD